MSKSNAAPVSLTTPEPVVVAISLTAAERSLLCESLRSLCGSIDDAIEWANYRQSASVAMYETLTAARASAIRLRRKLAR